ncbi:cell division protein FtsZ [Leadbetterella sp. DM7]|uniref:cell division protein FtsZ n=1 Tax=Leadbetterella sp. DM7 TaxID=3235085 RepID=UPI00349E7B63
MIFEPNYEIQLKSNLNKIIKVIGVGGAGCNAMLNMYNHGMRDVDFVACNTDQQVLNQFPEDVVKIQLGAELTKGLGAGTHWEVGRDAALESEEAIRGVMGAPTEMVFITAGMGGGTGTGAAPEIARVARELGRLTIGVVTDPFRHEGTHKLEQALNGIEKLKEFCDTVLIIKNDRLADMFADMDIETAYKMADEVLAGGVKSIAELITWPGVINLDFADVKTVLGEAGHAVMGTAEASGPERAFQAIEKALSSPLLENNNIRGAKRILVSMAYSDELPEYKIKMSDQSKIMDFVETQIRSQAQIFKHGYAVDRSLKDKIRVTIVAAKFENHDAAQPVKAAAPEEVRLGKGIHSVIPEKPRKAPKAPVAGQFDLFAADSKLVRLYEEFVQEIPDYDILRANPSYQRLQAVLLDDNEIEARAPGKVRLKELYDNLVNQNLIS